jgi:hypothetical protein
MAHATFMADGARNQSGKGSASERRAWSAATSTGACRCSSPAVTRVRFIRASSVSLPGESLATRSPRRSSRDHDTDHVEASATHRATAPGIREKQWPDHWDHRDQRVECVSTHSKKAWLSRVKRVAHFKSTFPIPLIACSSQSSRRPTKFWCLVTNAPSSG